MSKTTYFIYSAAKRLIMLILAAVLGLVLLLVVYLLPSTAWPN